MNTCSNCQHWAETSGNFGTCSHPDIDNRRHVTCDAHDWEYFEFHKDFGCIHFSQKATLLRPTPQQPLSDPRE